MTREQFKKRWESDESGGGITFDDIADCARAWGLCPHPKTKPLGVVTGKVLRAAGLQFDAEIWEET